VCVCVCGVCVCGVFSNGGTIQLKTEAVID